MKHLRSNFMEENVPLGDLFEMSNRRTFQSGSQPPVPRDICANRHKGNEQSVKAFRTVRDHITIQQRRVLACIKSSEGGLTCNEIAEKLGLTPNMVSGRCSELKMQGKITKAGTRLTRSGCPAAILKANG